MFNIEDFAKTGELFDGRYKLLRTLNTDGGSADVWLAVDLNTVDSSPIDSGETSGGETGGIQVAIKISRPKNALDIEGEQKFREEYKIVYNCHHANLLQPTNFSIFKNTPYLVLPYCKKGSSESLVGKAMTEQELWRYVHDVASGLAYLHRNKPPIIHQDIKPANVLIDGNGNYAITDFGISAQSGGRHEYYGDDYSGTFAYMAPERFADNPEPMAASDIWAFGATLYEVITGKAPFGDDGGNVQPDGKVVLDYQGKSVPLSIKKMIAACLDKDPTRRPTAAELADAARQKHFPIRKSVVARVAIAAGIAALALLLLLVFFGRSRQSVAPPSPAEVFAASKHLLYSSNPDSLKLGLARMDSLANVNYVPALEQLFFTYGWYSNRESLKRKQLLGIDVAEGWPSDPVCDKAASYLNRIIESSDSSASPKSKAEANYRLAAYKWRQGQLDRAKELLVRSKTYAKEAGDTVFMRTINNALITFGQ